MEKKARQELVSETKRKLDILQALVSDGLVTGEECADWRRQIIGLAINGPRQEATEPEEETTVPVIADGKRPRKKARIEGFTYYKPFAKEDHRSSSSGFGDGGEDTTFSFRECTITDTSVTTTTSTSDSISASVGPNVSGEGGDDRLPVRSGPSPFHMFDFVTKRGVKKM